LFSQSPAFSSLFSHFRHVHIQFSFSRFLSVSPTVNTRISHSSFTHFLHSAIAFSATQWLLDKVYVFSRQEFELQPLSICHCRFADFSVEEDGGAFWTPFSVDLFNVHFQNSTAKNGGCFFSGSSVRCLYCTFQQSQAALGGGFAVIPKVPESLTISHSAFAHLKATSSGGVHFTGNGSLDIHASNFTKTSSDSCGGAFESAGLVLNISFSLFVKISTGVINLRGLQHITITNTIFDCFSQNSEDADTGAALTAQACEPGSAIHRCYFLPAKKSKGCVLSFEAGGPVLITGCCFTVTRLAALFTKDAAVDAKDCRFEAECNLSNLTWPTNVGFHRGRTPTYTAAPVLPTATPFPAEQSSPAVPALSLTAKAVIVAIAFAAVFAADWALERGFAVVRLVLKPGHNFE
jgi:hypothetical protein